MRVSKGLFQNMFSGYSTELSTSSERLTRFKPTHRRDPIPEPDDAHATPRTARKKPLTEADVMARFGPAFDRDPRYDASRPVRTSPPSQDATPQPAPPMPELEENWFSNEGVDDIPLSVLQRSLPDRFEEMEAKSDRELQDWPLKKAAGGMMRA